MSEVPGSAQVRGSSDVPGTAQVRDSSDVPGSAQVRGEDAFDVARMADWLRAHAAESDGLDGLPEVRQFTGGASNLTYLLRYPDRDLILRRPPSGTKARGAHDMRREHDLQAALGRVFAQVPAMVAACDDEAVIGSPFYVMDRVAGTILRQDIPAALGLDEAGVRVLCDNAIDTLVALHEVDVEAAGLAGYDRGPGYVERQVGGWSQRFRGARTPDVGDFEEVMAWLAAHQPQDRPHVLVHNDYRFDNLVLAPDDPTRILAVLDWELATVGDPLMDLGSSLAYWVQPDDDATFQLFRRQPTNAPGMRTRWEFVERYAAARGMTVSAGEWTFYEVFGLFRLAVIAQQIHYRYFHGQTTNPAFAIMGPAVVHLEARCRGLLAG